MQLRGIDVDPDQALPAEHRRRTPQVGLPEAGFDGDHDVAPRPGSAGWPRSRIDAPSDSEWRSSTHALAVDGRDHRRAQALR